MSYIRRAGGAVVLLSWVGPDQVWIVVGGGGGVCNIGPFRGEEFVDLGVQYCLFKGNMLLRLHQT